MSGGERQLGGPSLRQDQNRTANAWHSRFYARSGGERSEQIALRSHDADFAVSDLHTLGQGAPMFAAIAAVDPEALTGGCSEFLDHGGRDRPLARALSHRVGAIGVGLGLVADGVQADDALLERRIVQMGDTAAFWLIHALRGLDIARLGTESLVLARCAVRYDTVRATQGRRLRHRIGDPYQGRAAVG
jgi:hypothetical protein